MHSLMAKATVLIFNLLLFSAALYFLLFAVNVYAQDSAGVSISPALIEETVDPGKSQEYRFTIKNLNDFEQTYYLSARNIEGVTEGNTPIFAEEGVDVEQYGIANWIGLDVSEVTLAAGEELALPFTLSVPQDASPGSHFGGIFVSVNAPEFEGSGAAVGYKVANIISIRVSGDANEKATIRQFSTSRYFHGSANVDFSLRVENAGNTLLRPTGPIDITNMLGKKVTNVLVNDTRAAIFPGSTREFTTQWKGEGTGFGRYEAKVALAYGDQGAINTVSSTVTFWILPLNIILPALGALLFLLLVTYFIVKVYIRRTLAQMGYSQTRLRRRRRGTPTALLLVIVMLSVTALFMVALLLLFA